MKKLILFCFLLLLSSCDLNKQQDQDMADQINQAWKERDYHRLSDPEFQYFDEAIKFNMYTWDF